MWDHERKNRSVIGEDLIVEGNIFCKSDLRIEGRVQGNVTCISLFVGRMGKVHGDITSQDVLVEGTVRGLVRSISVELKEGSVLEGDIASKTLAVDHGAEFSGSSRPIRETMQTDIKEAAE